MAQCVKNLTSGVSAVAHGILSILGALVHGFDPQPTVGKGSGIAAAAA